MVLTHDPEFKSQLRSVWLWDDWPGLWGPDKGIDPIAETFGDECLCVQEPRRRGALARRNLAGRPG